MNMVNLKFVTCKFKRIIGVLLILLCIIVRLITPFYIEIYWFIPFLIPAIGLIISDTTQNSIIFAGIGIFFGLCLIYISMGGIFDPYNVVANLYFNGVLSSIPEVSDVSTCVMGNTIMVIYAILNIICCGLFFVSTSCDRGY